MTRVKLTDLRIGNYVLMKFPNTTKEYIVSILTLSGEFPGQSQEAGAMIVNISTPSFALYGPQLTNSNYLSPIPVTEEMLIRNGFGIDLRFPNSSQFFLTKMNKNEFFLKIVHAGTTDIKVSFVHQLQNLYYALIQTELKFNFIQR